ncbi:hypothetical protein K9F62_03175 [Desulfovibrio sp. JY]|nr:hypothetical protein K9F62_03175 [Desulfovibrio sp. JY]
MRLSPHLRLLPTELDGCADILAKDLAPWTNRRFLAAVDEHRRRSNFVPTTRDLIVADQVAPSADPERIPLPTGEEELQEQVATNLAGVRRILDEICRGKRVSA